MDVATTGPTGVTNGAIGSGVIAFQTKVVTVQVTVTMAGARGGTIRIQIGALYSLAGVGVISEQPTAEPLFCRRYRAARREDRSRPRRRGDRAAEMMFAEEMGSTVDLSPAAKMALIVKITAAIEAAVAEEGQKLT